MNKQLTFAHFNQNFTELLNVQPQLLQLFEEFIELRELIPCTWSLHYYKDTGRHHDNSLTAIVSALLLQKLLSIPTVELLITFLNFSEAQLRNFCSLRSVPHPSFFSRFKQEYADDIESFFHKLVDLTEPICQELGQSLTKELGVNPAKVYIMDTTGIECFVKENNPKFFNALKKLQYLNKDKPKEEIYKLAYSQMPKSAAADSNIKLQYINGTFCYAHKTAVMSNALGILRHMDFGDQLSGCSADLPQVPGNSQSSELPSPEEIKVLWDGKLFKPAMENFFKSHPSFSIVALIADSGFDDTPNYEYLFKQRHILSIIKLNPRANKDSFGIPGINQDGIPTCPDDPSLPMFGTALVRGKTVPSAINSFVPKPRNFQAVNIFVPVNPPVPLPVVAGCFILIPKIISEPILPSPGVLLNGTNMRISAISSNK